MITGFNTDIEHDGTTYHVQTEDKGLTTPLILSLIYVGGTILASKRSPYQDLLDEGVFSDKVLAERLQRQHHLICAAVRAGRIEDLKRMAAKDEAAGRKKTSAQNASPGLELKVEESPVLPENQVVPRPQVFRTEPVINEMPALIVFKERSLPVEKNPLTELEPPFDRIPKPLDGMIFEVPDIVSEPIIEEVRVIEEELILPAEAVVILTETAGQTPVADDKLTITLPDEINLKSGERKTLSILVSRGAAENGLTKAHVVIKILGSTFRPLIFHAKTDSNGVAVVHLQLPSFKTGRAVLFIRAMYDGEETELRRVIMQN